jgi:hypothetical protein
LNWQNDHVTLPDLETDTAQVGYIILMFLWPLAHETHCFVGDPTGNVNEKKKNGLCKLSVSYWRQHLVANILISLEQIRYLV